MNWRWLWVARARLLPPDEDTKEIRREAAATKEQTEQALAAEHERSRHVAWVAAESRRLRTENNFSARIAESFRGRRW